MTMAVRILNTWQCQNSGHRDQDLGTYTLHISA